MYAVFSYSHLHDRWQLESRHRLLERAQDSARRLTSASHSRERIYHRDDVIICRESRRDGAAGRVTDYLISPSSFDF